MTSSVPLHKRPFKSLGGQPPFEAGDIEGFVDGRRIAILSYVRGDGRPNQVPIWYTHRNGTFYMTTTTTGPKRRAIERSPKVCLTIQDERPPYRALVIDGTATLRPLDEADDPTEGMATRYFGRLGAAAYDRMTAETYQASGLTLITLIPDEVKGFDNTKALSGFELAFIRLRERLPIPWTWL